MNFLFLFNACKESNHKKPPKRTELANSHVVIVIKCTVGLAGGYNWHINFYLDN